MKRRKIAFYHCHTPLHIGSGTTLDIIDLPIQREAHTDFPVMPSTSIKGVIRGEYWSKILKQANLLNENDFLNPPDNPKELKKLFKKIFKLKDNIDNSDFENCWKNLEENEKDKFLNCIRNFLEEVDENRLKNFWNFREFFDLFGYGDKEGDIIFTDGKVLLFPVKSVKGVFAWITCPLVLERFERDTECKIDLPDEVKNLKENEAVVGKDLLIGDNYLVLEELSFEDISGKLESQDNNNKTDILKEINSLLPEGLDKEIPASKIAILSNNNFRYFVKNHTEVNARTRIDQATGTVKEGALWYEELVPVETIFYNLILSRNNSDDNNNLELISSFIKGNNEGIFQFGGDETLGRGFTKVYVCEIKEESNKEEGK